MISATNLRFGTFKLGTDEDLVRASKVILENLIQKQRTLLIQEKLQENSKNVRRL